MPQDQLTCPNCLGPMHLHADDSCVLNALIGVLRDRSEHTDEEIAALHRNCDVDALWNDLGKIVDRLGDGGYNT